MRVLNVIELIGLVVFELRSAFLMDAHANFSGILRIYRNSPLGFVTLKDLSLMLVDQADLSVLAILIILVIIVLVLLHGLLIL